MKRKCTEKRRRKEKRKCTEQTREKKAIIESDDEKINADEELNENNLN